MSTTPERRTHESAFEIFLLKWSVSDCSAQFEVLDEDGEDYLSGFIKWDGCSEFDFERVHWCDPHGFRQHFRLLQHIYTKSFELMGREPDEPWDEPTTIGTY